MNDRIEYIFKEELKDDTSFLDKESIISRLFNRSSYTNMDMRETWHNGIKYGIEIGLKRSSPEGQIIELNKNTKKGKNKEFLLKFYKLTKEYQCSVEYHPELGMVILDKKYK